MTVALGQLVRPRQNAHRLTCSALAPVVRREVQILAGQFMSSYANVLTRTTDSLAIELDTHRREQPMEPPAISFAIPSF